MSLTDGYKKMSKSDPTKWSCLYFTDSADTITKKILKAKTDSIENVFFFKMTKKVSLNPNRVELTNLMKLYSFLNDSSLEKVADKFTGKSLQHFKENLAILTAKEMSYIGDKVFLDL